MRKVFAFALLVGLLAASPTAAQAQLRITASRPAVDFQAVRMNLVAPICGFSWVEATRAMKDLRLPSSTALAARGQMCHR